MHALVIYESMFGNTEKVAATIGEALAAHGRTDVVEVGHAPDVIDDDIDLLVVGGPTHVHGMKSPEHARRRDEAGQRTDRLPRHGCAGVDRLVATGSARRSDGHL